MIANKVQFHRYDHKSTADGFSYRTTDKFAEMEHELNSVSMNKTGFSLHVQIQNYTGEAVFLGGNLRTVPTRISSLQREGYRHADYHSNFVIIQLLTVENVPHVDPKKRVLQRQRTEIRIPARMLNTGSVFIKELDSYIMTEAQLDTTRELIVKDLQHQGWEHITIPQTMMKTDPATLYNGYKSLAEFCIKRQDKISIRIGLDLQYDKIPDIIKEMRVGILDSYFVPFRSYKLTFDPSLGPDDFVLENLHMGSSQSFRSTWTELQEQGMIPLDEDEVDTLFGKFYGLVLFSGEGDLLTYVHARKSEERFSNENLYLSNRTGDPLLRERVVNLQAQVEEQAATIADQTTSLQSVRGDNKRLVTELSQRDKTINELRTGHASKMTTETVLADIANDRSRTQNERDKIFYDTRDLDTRAENYPMSQKAAIWKSWGEMVKSGWAIVAAIAGGVISTIALFKKYKLSTA